MAEMQDLSKEARDVLRWTKAPRGQIDISKFPDFLIVGPQRTGTTWLHANLTVHPEILMSYPKEILFFNRLKKVDAPTFQSDELAWYLQHFEETTARKLRKNAACLWRYRQPYRPVFRGEASASYAALDPDLIDEVVAINPAIKIILMLRDPIDRAWSHAIKDLVWRPGREPDDVADAEFVSFFKKSYQLRCAAYVNNHENWTSRLRPGHLQVCCFEDIANCPASLLIQVFTFLGVSADRKYVSRRAGKVVGTFGKKEIPDRWRSFLLELLGDERKRAADFFDRPWR
ncbi:sulfotransferase domain-containing protein [Cognatiyoonia sp. IB215182]|uniref:sulfotransferase domain-containing protein n=1 Tax=Cognatiyoonia sp. IB215182 TaxID=3097353 RepID=UPI002A0CC910|nr:sulfotransferase domain-containing protein [Cognatiyoonia sp. IB215182]MDX8354318.1 sulfotransferase domain-containing protein [Cognatiyoonia sp. IB215182]